MKMSSLLNKFGILPILLGLLLAHNYFVNNKEERMAQKQKIDPMAYGLIAVGAVGGAVLMQLAKTIAPKSKHEKRVMKLDKVVGQLENYERQAASLTKTYKIATDLLKRRLSNLKTAPTS